MWDTNDDAMSVLSRDSRMPSLVMADGTSMQEFYARQAAAAAAGTSSNPPGTQRQRRNSASSVMSDTERLYGWSGSKGGVSNADQAPRYKIHNGKLVLNYPDSSNPPTPNNASSSSSSTATSATASGLAANDLSSQIRPALKPTRSDGTKPMYRPAFAPSADLPVSEDEADLDQVIVHDLPQTRPLRARSSLKQKLGSVLARVGSVKRSSATTPSPPAANGAQAQDYVSIRRSQSAVSPSGRRPDFKRKGSSLNKDGPEALKEENEENVAPTGASGTGPALLAAPVLTFSHSQDTDEDVREQPVFRDANGGTYTGGFVGLARKLSRRATTAGTGDSRPNLNRTRSVGRQYRDDRASAANTIEDKAAAEEMLRNLAKIPLYKPPRSAHVPNSKPLSSFAPRAPLRTSADNALANAPRYSYYQRPVKDADGHRRAGPSSMTKVPTTPERGTRGDYSSSSANRRRAGSTPSVFSTLSGTSSTGLLASPISRPGRTDRNGDKIPPVPSLPDIAQGKEWTQFKGESSHSLTKSP